MLCTGFRRQGQHIVNLLDIDTGDHGLNRKGDPEDAGNAENQQ